MPARAGRGDPGFYAERDPRAASLVERLAGGIGLRTQLAFGRRAPLEEAARIQVRRRAAAMRAGDPRAHVADLRYRLRRDGLAGESLRECFALYAAVLPEADAPSPEALAAAAALVSGSVADVADARSRAQALELAAAAFALCGVPVHLHATSEARARRRAAQLKAPFEALGLTVAVLAGDMRAPERRVAYGAAVTCGATRELGYDYLRDRSQLGRRMRPLQGRLERLGGDTTASGVLPVMNGLHCALVEDVDAVLLDDARLPLVLAADIANSPDRLPYEQALELARALEAEHDFASAEDGLHLTARGTQRLAELSVLLGGVWAARRQREELVMAALDALHARQRGRDYQVVQGALRFPPAEEHESLPETLQRLLEAKEGLAFAGRPEVLARLSVAQFFRRYLRLAGACADARGLERELWQTFGLHCRRAGAPPAPVPVRARFFRDDASRRAALAQAVGARTARGDAVVVAVRTASEAESLVQTLKAAGTRFEVLRGGPQAGEAAHAALQPGAVLLSLYPAHRDLPPDLSPAAPVSLLLAELHDAARHGQALARAFHAAELEQFASPRASEAEAGPDGPTAELAPDAAARHSALAQRDLERAAAQARAALLAREQTMEELLAFSGRPE